jgi:hypothetical protein
MICSSGYYSHQFLQDTLLSITNTNEGYIFVNQADSNVTQYIADLFPDLSAEEIQQGAAIYSSVPNTTVAEQCDLVMGECKAVLKASCLMYFTSWITTHI